MKKYFTLFVLLCGVYFLGESSAHAEATERTKEEIFQNWYTNYLHSFVGDPYEEKPSVNAPYATGSLKQEFLEEGLKAANFSRYLVGLPDDLELDPTLVNRAQHGAVVLAANKWITHSPSKPEGMSDEFYQEAKRSTRTSNLGPGDSLSYAVNQFMYDGHSNNYATVGHRKWILNPSLKKIGFGYANSFIAMQVFDTSRAEKVNYNYVAYPSNGYFPIEYMVQSDIPWSISLNPSIYPPTSPYGIKVTLTRLNDNKVWTFDYNDSNYTTEGEFFTYSAMGGYGSGGSIIFRPPVDAYREGDLYQVKVTGLQDSRGEYKTIEYKVNFFNLVQSMNINITEPIRIGEEIPYNIVMKTYSGETLDVTEKIPLKILSYDYEEQMMNGIIKVSDPLRGKVTLQACIVTSCVTNEPPYDEEGYISIETIGDSSKTIKGKTIPNFEVEIRTREYLYGPDQVIASGKVNHIGEFDIEIPKLNVDQIVVVALKNSEGTEIEEVIKTVIDNTPPNPPVLLSELTTEDDIITGTGESGNTLIVLSNGKKKSCAIYTDNTFHCQIENMSAGQKVTLHILEHSGNESEKVTVYVKDITPPSKPIVKQVDNNDTIITGSAEPGSRVWIKVGNGLINEGGTFVGYDGTFKVNIKPQKAGTWIGAIAIDDGGNESEFANQWVIDKTAPKTLTVNQVSDKTTYVTGKTEAKATVEVKLGSKLLGKATADSKGNYKVKIKVQKAGTKLTVVAKDRAKNAKTVQVTIADKTAPKTLTVSKVTNKTTYVTGKTEAKATVEVKLGSKLLGKATADGKGNYKVKIKAQKKGTKLTVVARDKANNAKTVTTTVK